MKNRVKNKSSKKNSKLKELLKKRSFQIIAGLGILLILAILVLAYSASIKHEEENIFVIIDGHTMTLKEARLGNYLYLSGPVAKSDGTTPSSRAYHKAENVYVKISDSIEGNLQELIDNGIDLCASGDYSYNKPIFFGHNGDQISFGGKTLQQAINEGYFCCTPDCSCALNTYPGDSCNDGCGGTCAGTKTCPCGCTSGSCDTCCNNQWVHERHGSMDICQTGVCWDARTTTGHCSDLAVGSCTLGDRCKCIGDGNDCHVYECKCV